MSLYGYVETESQFRGLDFFHNNKEYCLLRDYKSCSRKFEKFDLIISKLYTSPLGNLIILKARMIGIPTLLFSDGIIDWSNCFNNPLISKYHLNLYHPILHDYFLCVGKEETDYFNFLGQKTFQYLPDRMLNLNSVVKRPNNKAFLITTANAPFYNEEEKIRLLKLIKDTVLALNELGFSYFYRIYNQEIITELQIQDIDNHTSMSFEDCIRDADCVITTPSSISFTAMYHKRALAHFTYRDTPVFIQGGWIITSDINLKATLVDMANMEENRIRYQDYQVSKYLYDNNITDSNIREALGNYQQENIKKFINKNLYNMLNSFFNFNIEYFVRRIYEHYKKKNFMKFLRNIVK